MGSFRAHAQRWSPWSKAALNLGKKLDGKAGDAITRLGDHWSAKNLKLEHRIAEIAWKERNRAPVQYSDSFCPAIGLSDSGSAGSSCDGGGCGGTGC